MSASARLWFTSIGACANGLCCLKDWALDPLVVIMLGGVICPPEAYPSRRAIQDTGYFGPFPDRCGLFLCPLSCPRHRLTSLDPSDAQSALLGCARDLGELSPEHRAPPARGALEPDQAFFPCTPADRVDDPR